MGRNGGAGLLKATDCSGGHRCTSYSKKAFPNMALKLGLRQTALLQRIVVILCQPPFSCAVGAVTKAVHNCNHHTCSEKHFRGRGMATLPFSSSSWRGLHCDTQGPICRRKSLCCDWNDLPQFECRDLSRKTSVSPRCVCQTARSPC